MSIGVPSAHGQRRIPLDWQHVRHAGSRFEHQSAQLLVQRIQQQSKEFLAVVLLTSLLLIKSSEAANIQLTMSYLSIVFELGMVQRERVLELGRSQRAETSAPHLDEH